MPCNFSFSFAMRRQLFIRASFLFHSLCVANFSFAKRRLRRTEQATVCRLAPAQPDEHRREAPVRAVEQMLF